MAYSGTVGQTVVSVQQFIDQGARQAGKLAEELTVEQVQASKQALFFILSNLINQGIQYDVGGDGDAESDRVSVLTLGARCLELGETVTVHLVLHDLDDVRGALKPDAWGSTWRGDLPALQRRMAEAS